MRKNMNDRFNELKNIILEADNRACFIERERILGRLESEFADYCAPDRHAKILSRLLSEISTPIFEYDYFAGRLVEALPDEGMRAPSGLLGATGHMSPDYEKVLRRGLSGILEEIRESARKKGTDDAAQFARNAEIVVEAVKAFCDRYSLEAQRAGKDRMAKALATVPYRPAYDFYSALQGIWIVHMIASCYVGDRDYAFGRFDQYMYPYYRQAVEEGCSEDELCELLSGFFIKTNEICGRTTHNHNVKPIKCTASKQYVNIGGESPNDFSKLVLRAAVANNMPQPQITVLLRPDADGEFTDLVFSSLSSLVDKLHIYNYDMIVDMLIKKGIPAPVAKDFTFSACCTFDLNYHSYRREKFVPAPEIFLRVIKQKEYSSVEDILTDFSAEVQKNMQEYADTEQKAQPEKRGAFVFDSILLSDSALECEYPCDANSPYSVLNFFCVGIATLGDSLMVIDRLVFKEKRFSYSELIEILKNNFEGQDTLRQEILSFTRFGNDSDSDEYAALMGGAFLDAVDRLTLRSNFFAIAGFYSLERDNVWKKYVGATPDGRLAGEPFSENQSPTYGADRTGITALLKSLSKLPFYRTATGGLNLTFSHSVEANILKALTLSYFELGGFHVGMSVVDKEVLKDAMINPDKYKSLTVRLYGFSEYFISLPEWQQIAVINRTAY